MARRNAGECEFKPGQFVRYTVNTMRSMGLHVERDGVVVAVREGHPYGFVFVHWQDGTGSSISCFGIEHVPAHRVKGYPIDAQGHGHVGEGSLKALQKRFAKKLREAGYEIPKSGRGRRSSNPEVLGEVDNAAIEAAVRAGKARHATLRTPELARVVFFPSPVSHALYTRAPAPGSRGSVTTVALPGGRRTSMPGPGGGLLYVKWDDGSHMGVSPIDLYLIPTRVRETVRVRGRKKNPHEDDESISKIAMMLRPHFKDRRTLYIMSRSWHDYGFTPSQVRQYIDAGVTQPSKAAEMRLKQDIAKQRPRANPERSATSAAACATGMRAHTKSRRRIEKVCGKQAPKTHTASTRFSQMGVDARTRKLKR